MWAANQLHTVLYNPYSATLEAQSTGIACNFQHLECLRRPDPHEDLTHTQLPLPDCTRPIIICINVYGSGFSAELCQYSNCEYCILGSLSRSFSRHQVAFSIYEQSALSLVHSLAKFDDLISGC